MFLQCYSLYLVLVFAPVTVAFQHGGSGKIAGHTTRMVSVNGFRSPLGRIKPGNLPFVKKIAARTRAIGLKSGVYGLEVRAKRPWNGLVDDLRRRLPVYGSDWTDGLNIKTLSAVLLLYFALLAPTISFGGLTSLLTNGELGVVEFLVSHGISGILYSILAGQPMTFIAPTGLTLAFMSALFRFSGLMALPFLPLYSWVGLWTSGFLVILALGGACNLIKQCTTFTDDVFNALLATNFIYEAGSSLLKGFTLSGSDKTQPFLALNLAIFTCISSLKLSGMRASKYLTKNIREAVSDFGPIIIIIGTSLLSMLPAVQNLGIDFLQVPSVRQLANGRDLLVPIMSVPLWTRWAAALPAVLLTLLFYLDHLISIRVVNAPRHKLKKGEAYNQDLLALGLIVGLQSVCGLPWMCGATVQSLNHIRAMAFYDGSSPGNRSPPKGKNDATAAVTSQSKEASKKDNSQSQSKEAAKKDNSQSKKNEPATSQKMKSSEDTTQTSQTTENETLETRPKNAQSQSSSSGGGQSYSSSSGGGVEGPGGSSNGGQSERGDQSSERGQSDSLDAVGGGGGGGAEIAAVDGDRKASVNVTSEANSCQGGEPFCDVVELAMEGLGEQEAEAVAKAARKASAKVTEAATIAAADMMKEIAKIKGEGYSDIDEVSRALNLATQVEMGVQEDELDWFPRIRDRVLGYLEQFKTKEPEKERKREEPVQPASSETVEKPKESGIEAKAAAEYAVTATTEAAMSAVAAAAEASLTLGNLTGTSMDRIFRTTSMAKNRAALLRDENDIPIRSVVETRLSGLVLHSMILGSVCLLPLLKNIPMPVISGIFLYLGRKVMTGNSFLRRIQGLFLDMEKLPPTASVRLLGRYPVIKYTGIQMGCLAILWGLKSFKPTALFFPSVIGLLVVIRRFALPKLFNEDELAILDKDIE